MNNVHVQADWKLFNSSAICKYNFCHSYIGCHTVIATGVVQSTVITHSHNVTLTTA